MEQPLRQITDNGIIYFPSAKGITTDEFSWLFEAYYKRVYRYICYRINNQGAAEDLCSQVFERALTKRETYAEEKGTMDIWLFAIARNTVIDYYRSLKKESHLSLGTILDTISMKAAPDEVVVTHEDNERLWKALNTLREKERHIIAMKYAAELKNTEIAKLMCISDSQVGVILYRSMTKLRKHLKIEGDIGEK